jgi:hypothetical protein
MEQRLEACSHYCDSKRDKLYLPNNADGHYIQNLKDTGRNYLVRTKLGSVVYHTLLKIYRLLSPPRRYYSNNNVGIFLTTDCNLKCVNCQVSSTLAPANDIMTVEQIKAFVNEAISLKYYWDCIVLTGGEPTLHPNFMKMLDVLKQYKLFNPECHITLETNGAGDKVQSVLKTVPNWVEITNSSKNEGKADYDFISYHVAPIDMIIYKLFSDFSKGCRRVSGCYGLCLSMYGYYPSSPCMSVDRVFGFNIGIKELSSVTEMALRELMKILCKYCGWFNVDQKAIVPAEKMSRSWKKAFADYRKQKPKLSLYG